MAHGQLEGLVVDELAGAAGPAADPAGVAVHITEGDEALPLRGFQDASVGPGERMFSGEHVSGV